jgi:hypothetical protein
MIGKKATIAGGKTMEIKGQRLLGNKQEGGAMYLMSVLEQAHFINPIASAGEEG